MAPRRGRGSAPLFDRLATTSKKDRVVGTIRDAIVSGRMQPGDPIVEIRVARELGVGQPLVREALLALEHQGFVQRKPYRGTSVTKLSEADIAQIQALRVELEGLAVLWARRHLTGADRAELESHVDGMQRAAAAGNLTRFNDHDLAFHRGIWSRCGNRYLIDCLEKTLVPLLTFFYLRSGRVGELHVHSVAEHRAILSALTGPDDAGVLHLVRSNLLSLRDQCGVLVAGAPAAGGGKGPGASRGGTGLG